MQSTAAPPISHRSPNPPIHVLPNDILLEIFQFFKPDPLLTCTSSNRLFRLIAVSRRWRTVGLAARILWRDLYVSLPGPSKHSGYPNARSERESIFRRAATHLEACAGGSGASVTFVLDIYGTDALCRALFDLFLAHAPRWRSVHLRIPPTMYARIPFALSQSLAPKFTSMEHLALSFHRSASPISAFWPNLAALVGRVPHSASIDIDLDAKFLLDLSKSAPELSQPILSRVSALAIYLSQEIPVRDVLAVTLRHLPAGSKVTFPPTRDSLTRSPPPEILARSSPPFVTEIEELVVQSISDSEERAVIGALCGLIRAPRLRKLAILWIEDENGKGVTRQQIACVQEFLRESILITPGNLDTDPVYSPATLTHLRIENPQKLRSGFTFITLLLDLLGDNATMANVRSLDVDLAGENCQTALFNILTSTTNGSHAQLVPKLTHLALRRCKFVGGARLATLCAARSGRLREIWVDAGAVVFRGELVDEGVLHVFPDLWPQRLLNRQKRYMAPKIAPREGPSTWLRDCGTGRAFELTQILVRDEQTSLSL